ncbi:MAG: hypothetical protein HYU36_21130 [Planctomycetes bacterium]|nr:hypothetical protein [Planctomycetota bacterium]
MSPSSHSTPAPPGHVLSDLSIAEPRSALSETPVPDRWLIVPYEGEVSGKMLWCPVRAQPPDVSVPLPPLGRCRIYVGLYSSGTVPIWFNLFGARSATSKAWHQLRLRLSDEDWYDILTPEDYPGEPRFFHIAEALWKSADVTGKSLVLARNRKEAFADTHVLVAYVRLVPAAEPEESWPKSTKRLVAYFDSNFCGHYVDSAADVKSYLMPLAESDFDTVLWTTCREDTCYYPTRVGNRFEYNGTLGVYPYWAGRDLQRMLERGEDPLRAVCDVGHQSGLQVFASYRRMTCRLPPFVFPLHPDALFMRRPDLRCVDPRGESLPHLSLAFPEVRQRMIDLFVEQAENYDIDGVHLYFCRGVPFVFYERPFLETFQEACGSVDPRTLPLDDPRSCAVRARFVLPLLRDLRSALDRAGQRRGRRVQVALHAMNTLRNCRFYGLDVPIIIRERLVDLLMPAAAHYLPAEMGERHCSPESVVEFVDLARGTGIRICPELSASFSGGKMSLAEAAASFYQAGVHGLQTSPGAGLRSACAVAHRLGHVQELHRAPEWARDAARKVGVRTVGGYRMDLDFGIQTVG